jgi:hypothetical protein
MKGKICLSILFVYLFFASCKKEPQPQIQQLAPIASLETGLVSFSIKGQLLPTVIDTQKNVISIIIPHSFSLQSLTINFSLANQVNATVKNTPVSSGTTMDFSKLFYFTVTSADNKRSTTYLVDVETDLFYFGLTANLIAEKSLNKDYNFYYDQFDGSTWQSVDCGPTVATMAIKWADSTFDKLPIDARHMIEPGGGEWSTRNVSDYLNFYGVNMVGESISNLDSLVKANIDKNQVIILCLDTYYISVDLLPYQHLDKFYPSALPGIGHFLLVKGYKQMSNGFYLEVHDPWSQNREYYPSVIPHEPIGEDRYYLDSDIQTATLNWDPTAYIVAPKGQQVIASTKFNNKPIPMAYGQ